MFGLFDESVPSLSVSGFLQAVTWTGPQCAIWSRQILALVFTDVLGASSLFCGCCDLSLLQERRGWLRTFGLWDPWKLLITCHLDPFWSNGSTGENGQDLILKVHFYNKWTGFWRLGFKHSSRRNRKRFGTVFSSSLSTICFDVNPFFHGFDMFWPLKEEIQKVEHLFSRFPTLCVRHELTAQTKRFRGLRV